MAYTTINKSGDYFNTKLYTGSGSAGHSITGVGFQPDWTWIKSRSGTHNSANHRIYDAVRGVTKVIYSNLTNAEGTDAQGLTAFGTDGFTLGTENQSNGSSTEFASWNWKAGDSNTNVSASGSGNGAINACTYRANTTAGFSIVKYTGRNSEISNGQNTQVTHGLNAKAHFIITKALTGSVNWIVQGKDYNDANLHLNTTDVLSGSEFIGDNRLSTLGTTYFNAGNDNMVNENGVEFISYVFTEKTGYSKFGSYTGNGNNDGAFIYTGFKPAWVMVKRTNSASAWQINDTKRDTYNRMSHTLFPHLADAESSTGWFVDYVSNGFKIRDTGGAVNASGGNYIYMAFGQSLVGQNNVPCTAR